MSILRHATIQSGHTDFHPPPTVQFEFEPTAVATLRPGRKRILDTFLESDLTRCVGSDPELDPSPAEAFRYLLDTLLSALAVTVHATQFGFHPVTGARRYRVACDQADLLVRAGEFADSILTASTQDAEEAVWKARFTELQDEASRTRIDPDAIAVRNAAVRRGLPVRWLDQDPFNPPAPRRPYSYGLLQIGHGFRQRRLFGAFPMPVESQPVDVLDRYAMVTALIGHGIPVPKQDLEFPNKNRLSRLERAAERLGYPVALRPAHRAPFADWQTGGSRLPETIRDARELARSFAEAGRAEQGLWIEAACQGTACRFVVIGGTARTAQVVDASAPSAVENPEGRFSPEILAMVGSTAKAVGLHEFAGVEASIVDPRGPAEAPNFAVTDVFPDPRITPVGATASSPESPTPTSPEQADALAEALVDTLFPNRETRIPIVAVTGTNGKTTTVRMLDRILRKHFRRVGVAETDGLSINGRLIDEREASGVSGACLLLAEPDVDAAVLETARGDLLRRGTAFDVCDVAVLLNVSDDHVGSDGIDTVEQMARVKGSLLHRASNAAVVNADDPLCMEMAERIRESPKILVSACPDGRTIRSHVDGGGAAVLDRSGPEGDEIVLAEGDGMRTVIAHRDIPATFNGGLQFNRQNARHAVAAAWALGVGMDAIRDGLSEFEPDAAMNPGRFNFFDGYPFTVLLDYAHNPAGVRGVLEFINQLDVQGSRRLVCMTVGSRHRKHIDELAPALATAFDHHDLACRPDRIDKNPDFQGGDPAKNMLDYFRGRLIQSGAAAATIHCHFDRAGAIHAGLAAAEPGDLLVVLGHDEIAIPILKAGRSESPT